MFGTSQKQIIVTTQKEFDNIKLDYQGVIRITGKLDNITARPTAEIYVSGSATIKSVSDSATIESVSDSATIKSVSDSATIKSVSGSATIESVSDSATIKYVSDSATIKSVSGSATIKSVSGSATIKYVSSSATIKYVSSSATIKYVSDSATIESVSDSATIKSVSGSATINSVSDSATIKSVSGSATIKYVSDSATIQKLCGYAVVCLISGNAVVNCFGFNTVRYFEGQIKVTINKSKNTTVIKLPTFKPTIKNYKELYPIEGKGKILTLYKSVRKVGDRYVSNHNDSFEYKVGEIKKEKCDQSTINSCSYGIHVSHKAWAVFFGKGWKNQALLECEVNENDIVVASDTDGKVRCSKLKVIREVPKEEY